MTILTPAIKEVARLTKKPVLGIIPKIEFELPEEDSLVGGSHTERNEDLPRESWDWQIDLVAKAIKESADMDTIKEIAGI